MEGRNRRRWHAVQTHPKCSKPGLYFGKKRSKTFRSGQTNSVIIQMAPKNSQLTCAVA